MTRIGADAYHERIQLAIDQAGLDLQAIDVIRLVAWSIKHGEKQAWWKHRGRFIIEHEGGYEAVHEAIVGMTLGLLRQNPDMLLADAAQQAGHEYRKMVRPLWDTGYVTAIAQELTSLDGLAEGGWDAPVEDEEPAPPFDETCMTDPALIAAWEMATEAQREVLRYIAEGINTTRAAEHLGIKTEAALSRVNALRRKVRGAGLRAAGAAG